MENFFSIRAEKQSHIVNAAFSVFGRQGYKKASLSDIAQVAGITKGMITYYFGSKKTLYLYLVGVIQDQLIQAAKEKLSPDVEDFFEKLRIVTDIQVVAMKKHPAFISFVNSMCNETDPTVEEEIAQTFTAEYANLNQIILTGTDLSKFKPCVDPKLICKFIFWAGEGFTNALYDTASEEQQINELAKAFYICLDTMKNTFYKECAKR
jgi:AcrR family transcriptional regulator